MFRPILFHDRRAAGHLLAKALRDQLRADDLRNAIVLALPRGGVPVAYEIAHELHLALDVLVVRKLGAPGQQELAMGAIASGGIIVLQSDVICALGIAQDTIDAAAARERTEIERREAAYRAGRQPICFADRSVILVDDGLATGSTMKAAARTLRSPGSRSVARTVIVAVPIGAPGTCEELACEADRIVCLHTPAHFHAVGEFYRNFDQTSDEEVCALLAESAADRGTPTHRPE